MITLSRIRLEIQHFFQASVTAFEQSGCPLHRDSDLALFGDGTSFAIIAIPEPRDRSTDAHSVKNSTTKAAPETVVAVVPTLG